MGGRLARYLIRLADESGQPAVEGYFVVSRPTHQEIANSIGATRETVTRMLKQFEDRKLIRIKGSTVWVPADVPPGARENEWRRPLKGPWTLPNFITLVRLAALPFFLVSISDGRFGIALGDLRRGRDLGRRRRVPRAPLRHEVGPRRLPRSHRRQAPAHARRTSFSPSPRTRRASKVPVWLAVMVLSRDFLLLLVALLLILTSGKKRFPPSWAGKVTTVTQIVTVLFVLCANVWDWPREIVLIAFGATATATVVSGFDYLYRVARESRGSRSATR